MPLIVTYHPAYLLRSPGEKRKAWIDLKFGAPGTRASAATAAGGFGLRAPWQPCARGRRSFRKSPSATCSSRTCPRCVRIERASYAFPWTEGIFRDCLRVNYFCRVVELGGLIVGYGIMSVGAAEAHLLNVCVEEHYRSRGMGRPAARAPDARGRHRRRPGSVSSRRGPRISRRSVSTSHSASVRSACGADTTRPSRGAKTPSCSSAPSIRLARLVILPPVP